MQNQRVFVLDTNRKPLVPCHPARARKLLKQGRASMFRRQPFAIIIHDREGGVTQDTELRIDPGSKVTGCALLISGEKGDKCIFALEIGHRSEQIKQRLEKRRMSRRNRRYRKIRYRKPRYNNRTRPKGWLPPSLQSRVKQTRTWAKRLAHSAPISSLSVETVRFDTQKMQNPKISGVEYQQGELFGYEVREYLLEKWNRKCAYCGTKNIPLEIEHIVPRSRGGSNRVSNLTLSCTRCNLAKGNRTASEYGSPKIQQQARQPLRNVAAVNSTRYAIGNALKELDLPIRFWPGGRTKYNRTKQSYSKAHWIDAACVGKAGISVFIPHIQSLFAQAVGHGSRVFCRPDRHGFPRQKPKQQSKTVQGFRTGDFVKAVVTRGKKTGKYSGNVAVRKSGFFNIKTEIRTEEGISWKYCSLLQRADGYAFSSQPLLGAES